MARNKHDIEIYSTLIYIKEFTLGPKNQILPKFCFYYKVYLFIIYNFGSKKNSILLYIICKMFFNFKLMKYQSFVKILNYQAKFYYL